MKIRYVIGDLLDAPENYALQGVNAQAKMGSGVAKLLRDKYPKIYTDYMEHHKLHGLKLGDLIYSPQTDGKTIINAVSQEFYGYDDKKYVSYDAIDLIFSKLNKHSAEGLFDKIALPKIGAGLANGEWNVIAEIIKHRSKNFEPVVYVLDASELPQN